MKNFIEYVKLSWKSWLGYVLCVLLFCFYPRVAEAMKLTIDWCSEFIHPCVAMVLTGVTLAIPVAATGLIAAVWFEREKSIEEKNAEKYHEALSKHIREIRKYAGDSNAYVRTGYRSDNLFKASTTNAEMECLKDKEDVVHILMGYVDANQNGNYESQVYGAFSTEALAEDAGNELVEAKIITYYEVECPVLDEFGWR